MATLSGALLLLVTALFACTMTGDVFGRYFLGQPLLRGELFDLASTCFGVAFAGAALLALPAALAAPFVRTGDPPLKSRSALALVPGSIVALAACILGVVASVIATNRGVGTALMISANQLASHFGSDVFFVIPASVVLSAAFGGARTPEATAAAAAPTILVVLFGLTADVSIAKLLLALLAPMILAAILTVVMYAAAPARAVTPWLAGWGLACGLLLLTASGAFTPTEALGLVALFGLVVTIPVRVLALGQPLAAILRQAGMETAAVILALSAALLISVPLAYSGIAQDFADASGGNFALLAAAAIVFLVLAYLITAAVAMALALPVLYPLTQKLAFDPVFTGAIMVLLGLSAIAARARRGDPIGKAVGLPPTVAWTMAAALIGFAVLIIAFPRIAMYLVHEVLG